jgi:hypothetical protein
MRKVQTSHNNCNAKNNENICSGNGRIQEKERHYEIQFTTEIDGILNFIPL